MSICPANRTNSRRAIRPVALNAHVENVILSPAAGARVLMMEENGEIEIGDKFFSYEELESKIRSYELR